MRNIQYTNKLYYQYEMCPPESPITIISKVMVSGGFRLVIDVYTQRV